jgi:hypothetical protein
MGSEDWSDPYDLVPESFQNEFPNADSVRDALTHAGRLPSSTPDGARARCTDCGSSSITPHNTGPGADARADWKCTECGTWLDEPEQPDMTNYQTRKSTRFRWNREEDILLPKSRSPLDPPFADAERETAVALAILLRRPWREEDARRSYTKVARYLSYKDSWVGHRVREWRDGEHRDLVPDPTAEPEPAPRNEPALNPRAAVARIGGDYEELVADRAEANSEASAVATDGGRVRRWDAYGSD